MAVSGLDRSDAVTAVMAATGPRQLERVTAELQGAGLGRALREERCGLWFEWWFSELVEAVATRVRDELGSRGGAWEAP